MTVIEPTSIEAEILRQVELRGGGKSICPSEVARALRPDDWRPLMKPVRAAAVRLAVDGRLEITKKGKPVDPRDFKGVVRLRRPAG
jgi:hypothetical protein